MILQARLIHMAINCSLNVRQDGAECDSFKINSIYSLVVYGSKYYPTSIFRKLWLSNCRQVKDRLDDHLVDSDENYFFDLDKWIS